MGKEFFLWSSIATALLVVVSLVVLIARRATKVERSRTDDWIGVILLFAIIGFGASVLWPIIAAAKPAQGPGAESEVP